MPVNFVTGASSGIGRSLARRLALRGESVALVARRKPLLDSLAQEITAGGGRAVAIACDVTDLAQVTRAIAEAVACLGPIHRLVACAGGGEHTYVDRFEAAQFERSFALNVVGTAHCIEALLPDMLARADGHLVAVSSLAASRGLPQAAAYSAAKSALSNMMEGLRIDLAPRGIATTLVVPGFVRTNPSSRRRPLALELEVATERMCRAIEARRRHFALPWHLALVTGLARNLPAALYDRLLSGRASGD